MENEIILKEQNGNQNYEDFFEEMAKHFNPKEVLMGKHLLFSKATNGLLSRIGPLTIEKKTGVKISENEKLEGYLTQLRMIHEEIKKYDPYTEIGIALGVSKKRLKDIVEYVYDKERNL